MYEMMIGVNLSSILVEHLSKQVTTGEIPSCFMCVCSKFDPVMIILMHLGP